MPIAYYMNFRKGHSGAESRVGGQPTLKTITKPWLPEDDLRYGFIMQLCMDDVDIVVPGVSYIQIYQSVEEGDDPLPIAVAIPWLAPQNLERDVLVHPNADPWDITFESVQDPDEFIVS